jgi:DHA3 family tetracycline resistance protein-like MFS transporter
VIGLCSILVGAFPVYLLVLAGMAILGLGDSFLSGALDAWIANEIGEERVGPVQVASSQVAQIAILAGIPIGAALGSVALNIPILLSGAIYLLLALRLIIPEKGFQTAARVARRTQATSSRVSPSREPTNLPVGKNPNRLYNVQRRVWRKRPWTGM